MSVEADITEVSGCEEVKDDVSASVGAFGGDGGVRRVSGYSSSNLWMILAKVWSRKCNLPSQL